MPQVKPALADAMSIDGPTLVPHIEKPMWCHLSDFPARNLLLFLLLRLAQIPIPSKTAKYVPRTTQSIGRIAKSFMM